MNIITVQYSKELSLDPKFKINAGCPVSVKTAGNYYSTSVRLWMSVIQLTIFFSLIRIHPSL